MIRDRMSALKEALGEDGYMNNEDTGNAGSDNTILHIEDGPQADMAIFLSQVSDVRGKIEKMSACVQKSKKLHSEILSSSQTEEKKKSELEDITADFKRHATTVKAKISEIAKACESIDSENMSAAQRTKWAQHSALRKEFVEVMTEHNNVQEDYRDRCKARIQRQLQITGRTTTDEELDQMLEEGNLEVFTKGILKETQQARAQLRDIEERHAEIVKLETSIKELHQLFIDMALLVESQGVMVDNIEKHVLEARDYVETAEQQTRAAVSYQSKARKKKIFIGICISVVLIIILLAIILSI